MSASEGSDYEFNLVEANDGFTDYENFDGDSDLIVFDQNTSVTVKHVPITSLQPLQREHEKDNEGELTKECDEDSDENSDETSDDCQDYEALAQEFVDTLCIGNDEIIKNTSKDTVRFIPIYNDKYEKAYIVIEGSKNQFNLRNFKNRTQDGREYMKQLAYIDSKTKDSVKVQKRRQYIIDIFNSIKRLIVDKVKGFIKIPKFDDQTRYYLNLSRYGDELKRFLQYQKKTYNIPIDLANKIMYRCRNTYVIHVAGIRIRQNTQVTLEMRLCRIVPGPEFLKNIRRYDDQMTLTDIVNRETIKSIDSLKAKEKINLKKWNMRKQTIATKLSRYALSANDRRMRAN